MVLMCLDWWKKQANFSTTVDRKKVWCSDCAGSHAGSVSLKKNKLCPTWGLLEDSRVGAPMTKNTGQWRQWSEREDGAAIASSARGAWWLGETWPTGRCELNRIAHLLIYDTPEGLRPRDCARLRPRWCRR
jgi:hypothetical protein